MGTPASRFECLDALRGVAALTVVVFHVGQLKMLPAWMPHGHLAVDFFFILSGVVIAHAYEARRVAGMTVAAFMGKRLVRLMPLATAGALLGLAVLLLKGVTAPEKVDPLPRLLLGGAFNAVMLPSFVGGWASGGLLYPGNPPLWSLFFELVANGVWMAWLAGRRSGVLMAVVALCGAVLAACAVRLGTTDVGWDRTTFWLGLARVGFGFPLGALLYRGRHRLGPRRSGLGAGLLVVVLLATLAAPFGPAWPLFGTLVLLPTVVMLGIVQQANPFGRWLGDVSYPLYALHYPVVMAVSGARQLYLPDVPPAWVGVATVLLCLALASAALHWFDEPLREALASWRGRGARSGRVNTRVPPSVIPANAGVHEKSELRSMNEGVLLGVLAARVDPGLRGDEEASGGGLSV